MFDPGHEKLPILKILPKFSTCPARINNLNRLRVW